MKLTQAKTEFHGSGPKGGIVNYSKGECRTYRIDENETGSIAFFEIIVDDPDAMIVEHQKTEGETRVRLQFLYDQNIKAIGESLISAGQFLRQCSEGNS